MVGDKDYLMKYVKDDPGKPLHQCNFYGSKNEEGCDKIRMNGHEDGSLEAMEGCVGEERQERGQGGLGP